MCHDTDDGSIDTWERRTYLIMMNTLAPYILEHDAFLRMIHLAYISKIDIKFWQPIVQVGEHPPHKEGRTPDDFCLTYIRGAEVVGMLDEDGKVINPLNKEAKGLPRGHVRRYVFVCMCVCACVRVCVCNGACACVSGKSLLDVNEKASYSLSIYPSMHVSMYM